MSLTHVVMPKVAPPPPIDFAGPQGGMMALAFAGGCVFAASLLAALGALIWRAFGDKRIKELAAEIVTIKAEHERDRAEERRRCDREIEQLRDRILQLETILTTVGPPGLRNAVQAAISEARVDNDRRQEQP